MVFKNPLSSASIVYLNPAYILSGSILGYIDIFFAPFLLFVFYLLEINLAYLAGIFLALSLATKLLPLLVLPAFLASFVHFKANTFSLKIDIKKITALLTGILTIVLPTLLLFGYQPIKTVFQISLEHGYNLSNNATNLNFLLKTFFYKNNITPGYWLVLSKWIFYATSVVFLVKTTISKRSSEIIYKASIAIIFAYYTIVTGVHENHLFPAVVISTALIASHYTRNNLKIFLNISLIFFLNLFVFYWFGYILRDGLLIRIMPPTYQHLKHTAALIVSFYSTFYFVKYSISFLKQKF